MNILHTEASNGWGGQEIRILKESEGMARRGHTIVFAVVKGGKLVQKAREKGFVVYECNFKSKFSLKDLKSLIHIIKKHNIDIVNTHSSTDAWVAGVAAKFTSARVIRTRHISVPIRKGLNSLVLYNLLADVCVTTCEEVALMIRKQARREEKFCLSIPTGIDSSSIRVTKEEVKQWKKENGVADDEILVGTACVIRSWKGVDDFILSIEKLSHHPKVKGVIVGDGPVKGLIDKLIQEKGLEKKVIRTGFLTNPFPAIAAMDIFTLLSKANEGVSQAVLQAAFLKKPLICTPTGGLHEVCLHEKTGFIVPKQDPEKVAFYMSKLICNKDLRKKMGEVAYSLVKEKFSYEKMLDEMERVYQVVS